MSKCLTCSNFLDINNVILYEVISCSACGAEHEVVEITPSREIKLSLLKIEANGLGE